jgi:hypothetical protein
MKTLNSLIGENGMKRIIVQLTNMTMILFSIIVVSRIYGQIETSDNPRVELVINAKFNSAYKDSSS